MSEKTTNKSFHLRNLTSKATTIPNAIPKGSAGGSAPEQGETISVMNIVEQLKAWLGVRCTAMFCRPASCEP